MNTSSAPPKKYGADDAQRALAARCIDLARRAHQTGRPTFSDFLSPADRGLCLDILEIGSLVDLSFEGGYADAERTVAIFAPRGCAYRPKPPLAVLSLIYKGPALSHRDLLGSLMGLGIKRQKLGDILAHANPPLLICEHTNAP
jgi:RNA-binding protein YlmH